MVGTVDTVGTVGRRDIKSAVVVMCRSTACAGWVRQE